MSYFVVFFQVHGSMIENSECTVYFQFVNVVTEKLEQIKPKLVMLYIFEIF